MANAAAELVADAKAKSGASRAKLSSGKSALAADGRIQTQAGKIWIMDGGLAHGVYDDTALLARGRAILRSLRNRVEAALRVRGLPNTVEVLSNRDADLDFFTMVNAQALVAYTGSTFATFAAIANLRGRVRTVGPFIAVTAWLELEPQTRRNEAALSCNLEIRPGWRTLPCESGRESIQSILNAAHTMRNRVVGPLTVMYAVRMAAMVRSWLCNVADISDTAGRTLVIVDEETFYDLADIETAATIVIDAGPGRKDGNEEFGQTGAALAKAKVSPFEEGLQFNFDELGYWLLVQRRVTVLGALLRAGHDILVVEPDAWWTRNGPSPLDEIERSAGLPRGARLPDVVGLSADAHVLVLGESEACKMVDPGTGGRRLVGFGLMRIASRARVTAVWDAMEVQFEAALVSRVKLEAARRISRGQKSIAEATISAKTKLQLASNDHEQTIFARLAHEAGLSVEFLGRRDGSDFLGLFSELRARLQCNLFDSSCSAQVTNR
jgi:hypothetical protein